MGLVLLVAVGAVVAALLAGGSWLGFNDMHVRRPWLVIAAIVAQALGVELAGHASHDWYTAGLAVSAAIALVFCLSNLRLAGLPLITVGLALNALVVGLNTSMPVSIFSASRANVSIAEISIGEDPRHSIAGLGTTWRALGDTIPVPLPVAPEVVSPGDVLVAAGIAELLFVTMRRKREDEPAPRPTPTPPPASGPPPPGPPAAGSPDAPAPFVVTLFNQ